MSVQEFVKKLNIDDSTGKYTEKMFTMALKDSNDFARMYSILDNMRGFENDVHMTENHSICNFYVDNFDITLEGDLTNDAYVLTMVEVDE